MEVLSVVGQVGQILIGELDAQIFHMAFGASNKVAANEVTNATRARVQHHPDLLVFIEADFYKVVARTQGPKDRKSTRLNSSHVAISYAVFCLKKTSKEQA